MLAFIYQFNSLCNQLTSIMLELDITKPIIKATEKQAKFAKKLMDSQYNVEENVKTTAYKFRMTIKNSIYLCTAIKDGEIFEKSNTLFVTKKNFNQLIGSINLRNLKSVNPRL